MRVILSSVTALLAASVLSGCCCCCCDSPHSPIAYSAGNPYECSCDDFWGVGYYIRQYGFLRSPDPCSCYASVPAGYYDYAAEPSSTPAPSPDATVPTALRPYDSETETPPVAPPAP